jgi:hypothetical protein
MAERSYAFGGGISGAATEEAGMRTARLSTLACRTCGGAIAGAWGARSAVMHGMAAVQLPDDGPEHGAVPVEVRASGMRSTADPAGALFAADRPMLATAPGAFALAIVAIVAIGCMSGTTHTAPPATIVR